MRDPVLRPPTLMTLPSYLAGHVSRIGHRTLVEELAGHGLRLPHFAVLAGLHDVGPVPQHELADRLGLNRSHLVGYLDDLERNAFVARTRDAADRRRHRIELSDSGRLLAIELIRVAERSEAANLGALTMAERATLTELLGRVLIEDDAAAAEVARLSRH